MTAFLFFCTANVSVELIKEFVVESQRPAGTTNVWCLARDPTQKEFAEGTAGLVEPVNSGFVGYSADDLIKYIRGLPKDNTIDNGMVVILDERTTRDKTVAIHTLVFEMPDHLKDDWVHEEAIASWKQWRVPFSSAAHIVLSLENRAWGYIQDWGFTGKMDNFIDEEGVLQLPSLNMKEFDMLDEDGWPD